MATTQAGKAAAKTEAEGNKKSKSKMLLIGIIVLLLIIIGGGAWFMLHGHANKAGTVAAKAAPAPPPKPPVFFQLKAFTVNLQSDSLGPRLLYVHITLQVADKATSDWLKLHLPQVRNQLLLVLSGQQADTLINSDGKQHLAGVIRDALNQTLAKAIPDTGAKADAKDGAKADKSPAIKRVLFTQFIVQ